MSDKNCINGFKCEDEYAFLLKEIFTWLLLNSLTSEKLSLMRTAP